MPHERVAQGLPAKLLGLGRISRKLLQVRVGLDELVDGFQVRHGEQALGAGDERQPFQGLDHLLDRFESGAFEQVIIPDEYDRDVVGTEGRYRALVERPGGITPHGQRLRGHIHLDLRQLRSGGERNKDQHREYCPGVHRREHEQPFHPEFPFSTLLKLCSFAPIVFQGGL